MQLDTTGNHGMPVFIVVVVVCVVQFPNFVGVLLSVVQLSMFLLYSDKRPKRSSSSDPSA